MADSPDPTRYGAINEVVHNPEIQLPSLNPGGTFVLYWDPYAQYITSQELEARLSLLPSGSAIDAETVRDLIAAALRTQGLISVTVNDAGDTITIGTTATVNESDAYLRNRANHTGTQAIATITNLHETLNGKMGDGYNGLPAGTTITVTKNDGVWPARPTARADITVMWKGPDPTPAIVSSGTGGMINNVDIRLVTP